MNYFLVRSTSLSFPPRFEPLATNLPGQIGVNTCRDTNPAGAPSLFYRVGVDH